MKTKTNTTDETRLAQTDHPVHELIRERWSPYVFDSRPVAREDLQSLFEAARWAPSSFNEQPWRFIVATRDDRTVFEKVLSCLSESNQAWASACPVLVIGTVRTRFSHNDNPNRVARHDLGLAVASLTFEATARGLAVHQMAGMSLDKAREIFAIPEEFEAVTTFAIGYPGDPESSAKLGERDRKPRTRHPLAEQLFGGRWGEPSGIAQ